MDQHSTRRVFLLSLEMLPLNSPFYCFLLDAEVHTDLSGAQNLHAYALPFPTITSYPELSMTSK